jgi:colicin import membrane protein
MFSGLLHVICMWAVFVFATMTVPKAPLYPSYTVELVGGEKLGGGGAEVEPAPKRKSVPEPKPAPEVKETKKRESKKLKEESAKLAKANKQKEEMEALALAKAKKEEEERQALALVKAKREEEERQAALAKKKEEEEKQRRAEEEAQAQKVREKLKELREKRIDEALAEAKRRSEAERQRQQKAPATGTVASGKIGAAAPGVGGTGGGIYKGIEFVRYYNEMRQRIKDSWTWVGKRIDLEVTVRFGIQGNGEITGLKLVRGSSDPSYDDSVLRAVRKASPLSPPPDSYRKDFMDVELTFRPKDLGG